MTTNSVNQHDLPHSSWKCVEISKYKVYLPYWNNATSRIASLKTLLLIDRCLMNNSYPFRYDLEHGGNEANDEFSGETGVHSA